MCESNEINALKRNLITPDLCIVPVRNPLVYTAKQEVRTECLTGF